MENYRRLSGDGSVKVVLSGDSNSPPKTTSRREPLPYNSSPTQEVCPSIPTVAADVRRLTYSANRLQEVTLVRKPDQTYSSSQPEFSSSGLCDLCVFLLKGKLPSHPEFQKKPVFAPIRGLCESHPAPEKVDFRVSQPPSPSASVVSSNQMYLRNNFSSCRLCGLCVFAVKGSSNPNRSKKPVSSPKFTFQHSTESPCLSASVVSFPQFHENVDLPAECLRKFQKKARIRRIRANSRIAR
jgi:hypothetical protein